jgi:hypothetical protein
MDVHKVLQLIDWAPIIASQKLLCNYFFCAMIASLNFEWSLKDSQMKHTLLPQRLQAQLMDAAATKRLDKIDAAIKDVRQQVPLSFHNDESLKTRVFFDEPTGAYSGAFINASPRALAKKQDVAQ